MNESTETPIRKVELVDYSDFWKTVYKKEEQNLKRLLKSNLFKCHHIGSTAIPAIKSKPTLDILCEVHTLDGIEVFKDDFERAGFQYRGSFGIEGRVYLVRLAPNGVDHLSHIHIYERGNQKALDHLDFRDYLNSEVVIAKEYEKLKIALKEKFYTNPESYQSGKSEFIELILKNLR